MSSSDDPTIARRDVPTVVIDGPAGVGKGTIAKLLATKFGFHYLDSGAVYRALAARVIDTGADSAEIDRLVELGRGLSLAFPPEQNYEAI